MLINIRGDRDERGRFIYVIPKLQLDTKFNYKIGVTLINFETMPSLSKFRESELLCINTNLLDRTGYNTKQTLLHVPIVNKEIQHHTRSFVLYHNLYLRDLESASFTITPLESERSIELRKIFLQLDIIRVDTYGRI